MFEVTLEIASNSVFLEVIDHNFNHFFAHQFNPNSTIEWFSGDLKIERGHLKGLAFRNMSFDVQTNLEGVKSLLGLNPNSLNLYQFNKPISGSLLLENFNEVSRNKILKQNGLQHIYSLQYEYLTIKSFDISFINSIKENVVFKEFLLKG